MSYLLNTIQALSSYALAGAGTAIGDTTILLKSFKDIDGNNITMTDAGTILFFTLDPGNGSLEEQACCSGITQNANGTATLTGVKSVGFKTPYTQTTGLLKVHAGASPLVISNTSGYEQSIIDYINSVAIAGAPDASTSVKGISKLSTAPVSAINPIVVGDNDTRVPTQGENDALAGNGGTPSSSNKYVTETGSSVLAKNCDVQIFTTPGANTWTMPAGAKSIYVRLIGGGGGGGGGGNSNGGSGGGGGAIVSNLFRATDITSPVTVTVASTAAGSGANTAGTTGVSTSFGTYLVAQGGGG